LINGIYAVKGAAAIRVAVVGFAPEPGPDGEPILRIQVVRLNHIVGKADRWSVDADAFGEYYREVKPKG